MMNRIRITLILVLLVLGELMAQTLNSDNKFQRPLSEVIANMEARFGVAIKIDTKIDSLVLNYADWRIRPWDINETFKNVLSPFDLVAWQVSENSYEVKDFRYHLRTEKEAADFFAFLSAQYDNKDEWESRREILRAELIEATRLNMAPEMPKSKPIFAKEKKIGSYTIQNFALETMPGVYACGTIYRPANIKGKVPLVLCPMGHFYGGRANKDLQARCAALATMGAVAVQCDLMAWGESELQFKGHHSTSLANTVHLVNNQRVIDFMLTFKYIDANRIGVTGGSGGGSQTILLCAIDPRVAVSVPVVMMSAIHSGGCPCESGNPVHLCAGGTNNVELAAMFAPKPQLIVSDGGDWTKNVPNLEFPFLQRSYSFYNASEKVENVHLINERHDYGASKRAAMYKFMAKYLMLDDSKVFNKHGELDESFFTPQNAEQLKVFTDDKMPENAIDFQQLQKMFNL
ncbi:MAG: alpha/beta hydrolase family protein [Mangrovibacterium sp.]